MLYEIQQSSDVTYRFYDWDRVDAKGNKRELHLDKALDVTDLHFALDPVPAPDAPLRPGTGHHLLYPGSAQGGGPGGSAPGQGLRAAYRPGRPDPALGGWGTGAGRRAEPAAARRLVRP